ncbi:hypothetical protein EVAR_73923_1 [Eumeta japonica]|uniref:Uncharacterized protein n=1 Tax=Eumeta variegata TaxID=151549 RepID=A0A4C1TGC3_EUMVA|nr:hypothetical protein EVAR_73923_1 [Eumeta japonica]
MYEAFKNSFVALAECVDASTHSAKARTDQEQCDKRRVPWSGGDSIASHPTRTNARVSETYRAFQGFTGHLICDPDASAADTATEMRRVFKITTDMRSNVAHLG